MAINLEKYFLKYDISFRKLNQTILNRFRFLWSGAKILHLSLLYSATLSYPMLLQVSGTLHTFQSMTLASRKEFYRNKGKTGFRHPDQMTHENTARHRCSPVTGVREKMWWKHRRTATMDDLGSCMAGFGVWTGSPPEMFLSFLCQTLYNTESLIRFLIFSRRLYVKDGYSFIFLKNLSLYRSECKYNLTTCINRFLFTLIKQKDLKLVWATSRTFVYKGCRAGGNRR